MNVLFCTDGSKISYNSIKNFTHWVKDATVDIICVIDWSFLPDSVSVGDSEFAMQCANSANSILDYSEKFLKENDICVGKKIKMCGSTVDSILDIADKSDYKFIVLGSHGKKGIQKWLGSVSQEIASVAKLSTYISKFKTKNKKILFTIDSTDLSSLVVKKCLNSLDLTDKEIYLVNVFEIPDYLFLDGNFDSNWILDIKKQQEKASLMLLSKYEKMFNDVGLFVYSKVTLNGVPSTEIINFAESEGIDLVVNGTKDRKYLSKFLLGSVSKRILENVKSDVLIVRT